MTGDNYSGVCHMVIAGEGSDSLHWDDSRQHSGDNTGIVVNNILQQNGKKG